MEDLKHRMEGGGLYAIPPPGGGGVPTRGSFTEGVTECSTQESDGWYVFFFRRYELH